MTPKFFRAIALGAFLLCGFFSLQAQNTKLEALGANAKDVSTIYDDYKAGLKFLGEYTTLVHRGVKENNPALFDEAKVNLRRAQTLLGNAYTREKAYQGVDKQTRFNPVTLRQYRSWMNTARSLESGKYIELIISQSKADGPKTLKLADLEPAPAIGNVWEDGQVSSNGPNADYSRCIVGKWEEPGGNQWMMINADGSFELHYQSTQYEVARGVTIGKWQIKGTRLSFGKTTFSYEKSNKYAQDLARANLEPTVGILDPESNKLYWGYTIEEVQKSARTGEATFRGVNIDCSGNAIFKGKTPHETEAVKNFQAASDDYSQGRYTSSLDKIALAENRLGGSNAALEALKARNHFRQGNPRAAQKAIDNFTNYRSSKGLLQEVRVLADQIRQSRYQEALDGLDQQKEDLDALISKRMDVLNTVKGRILRRIYRGQVDELNELLGQEKYAEALSLYQKAQESSYFKAEDIPAQQTLHEYIALQEAKQKNQARSYIAYVNTDPQNIFKGQALKLLKAVLVRDAQIATNAKNYAEAVALYEYHQAFFPTLNTDAVKSALSEVHRLWQTDLFNTAEKYLKDKRYHSAIQGYDQYLDSYPQGLFADKATQHRKKARLYQFEPQGSFWTVTSKGGLGWSYDFASNLSIGSGFGFMFNPVFFLSDLESRETQESFDFNQTYESTGEFDDVGYLFAIHFDLNYQIVPRFWMFAGVAYGYYDYYEELNVTNGSFNNGLTWLRDLDYAGWKVSPRVGGYFVIKPGLTLKYGAVIRNGVSHQIGISFAGP